MHIEKKQYHTVGRELLLTYLKDHTKDAPESADDIYQGLSAAENAPGRSSVYRMLGELEAKGLVRRFRADAAAEGSVFQYVGEHGDCNGHFHLQCVSCGKISHLKCACSADIAAHLMKAHGFSVDSGRSVLYGTCATCCAGGK